jgi:hypothetical protein
MLTRQYTNTLIITSTSNKPFNYSLNSENIEKVLYLIYTVQHSVDAHGSQCLGF